VRPAMHQERLGDLFAAHQRSIWGISYRMTGCAADADEIVQETFLRALERGVPAGDRSWKPWLTRVAVNLGVDLLRRRKRTAYVGSWLPSPVEMDEAFADAVECPEARYSTLESVTYAFLLALEALNPKQRAVLLLRDVLDYSAAEAGEVLRMSEGNVRITHQRARRLMQAYDQARCNPNRELRERTRAVLAELVRCLLQQDAAGMEALLADGVRTVTDGGREYTALRAPMVGRSQVATLHLRVARRRAGGAQIQLRLLNGIPALLIEYASAERRQAPRAVLRCELAADGRIRELHSVMAPRKLTAVRFSADPNLSL
jgi:RNA polymerase sigma-70 factor (ECF subfamily)